LIEKRQVENVGANNYLPEENDLVTSYEYNNNDLLIKAISPS
jgi:hypothetical protein